MRKQEKRNKAPQSATTPERQQFAIDTSDLLPLWAKGGKYGDAYKAACAVVQALNDADVPAYISAGGISFSTTRETLGMAELVLLKFGLKIDKLSSQTFHQQLIMAGSLQKLYARNPTGRAGQIIARIVGDRN